MMMSGQEVPEAGVFCIFAPLTLMCRGGFRSMAWDGRGKTNDSERNASAKICAAFIGFFRVVKNDHTGRGRPRKGTDILCKKYERSLNLINPANMAVYVGLTVVGLRVIPGAGVSVLAARAT
jgi:hypothetical protein